MAERDLAKEQGWRGIIANWQASDISMAEYCRLRDIDYRNLSKWRQIIRARDLELSQPKSTKNKQEQRRSVPLSRVATRVRQASRLGKSAPGQKALHRGSQSVEFAEVKLVDHPTVVSPGPAVPSETVLVEIILSSGIKLRPNAACPIEFLSSVISILEKR